MKIAILGGGFTGLTAAHELQKKGHEVTIFEKDKVLGGLAAGFRSPDWEWPLERVYHHLFTNDYDILNFAKEIGFNNFLYKSPITASLYDINEFQKNEAKNKNYRIFPVDSPQGLLKFPLMSLPAKLRIGAVAAWLKYMPFSGSYERQTAAEFLKKFGGEEGWHVFWEPLMRKKFGKYAEKVLASFIWARITKRSKDLIYIEKGFQTFIDHVESQDTIVGVKIHKGFAVQSITKTNRFNITYTVDGEEASTTEEFDSVVSTLPTVIMAKITSELFPASYLDKFKKLEYMSAVNLIIETDEALFEKIYWLSCCVKDFPFLVTVQHTHLIDKSHYGGKHILYVGNYVENDDTLMKMNKQETLNYLLPYLKKISHTEIKITNSFHFKAGFAQPIFDKTFIENKPDFETPIKDFFIANLDMTYPYDRGTNYAVQLGKRVSEYIK